MMARLYLPKRSVNPEEIVMSHRLFSTIVCLSTLLLSIGSANGQTYKNIALNPKDVRAPGHGFPHASSNSEYPCIYPQDTAGGNQCAPDTTFLALSAINGDTNNASHGTLAYASWGPQLTVPGLWWKVDFGHNVTVDKVKIWVRADWAGTPSHDSYWKKATLVFSNGTRDTISIDSVRTGQSFAFSSRVTQSIIITDFVASNPAKWCAFTEVQVWGYDPATAITSAPSRSAVFSRPGAALCVEPGESGFRLSMPPGVWGIELYDLHGRKIWASALSGSQNPLVVAPPLCRSKVVLVRYLMSLK